MAAGGGGRTDIGMPGTAGARPLAGMIGVAVGASSRMRTGGTPNDAAWRASQEAVAIWRSQVRSKKCFCSGQCPAVTRPSLSSVECL